MANLSAQLGARGRVCVCVLGCIQFQPGELLHLRKIYGTFKICNLWQPASPGVLGGVAYLQCQQNDRNSVQNALREREGVEEAGGVHCMIA